MSFIFRVEDGGGFRMRAVLFLSGDLEMGDGV